ncbi:MAG TPA: hypothetical protein VGL74_00375 [Terriglobales bacterium]|jgi:hypothetical protein
MPVDRQGRYVYSSSEKLNSWLGRETDGEPVHIANEGIDLGTELKRGLSFVRQQRRKGNSKKKVE